MKSLVLSIFFLVVSFQAPTLKAHPHSWVSVLTEIEGDSQHIKGLKMFWTFDLITTSDALDGEDLSEDHRQDTLQNLAAEMLKNIKETGYYTRLHHNDRPLAFKDPKQALLTLEDYKLTLQFYLALEKPVALPATNLSLKVYEETYYVDFLWLQVDDLQLSESFYADCKFKLLEPQTTTEQIAYAASLEKDAKGDSKLGEMFTQTASIDCL